MRKQNPTLPVINLYGGPGCGKSTSAALIFGKLKQLGYNVELCTEYAKTCVWRKAFEILNDQLYILGKQNHKLHVLKTQCDAAITDSPLPLTLIYNKELENLTNITLEVFNQYHNFNYIIERSKLYNPSGRMQTENEAVGIDGQIKELLDFRSIPYTVVPYGDEGVMVIVQNFVKWFEANRS